MLLMSFQYRDFSKSVTLKKAVSRGLQAMILIKVLRAVSVLSSEHTSSTGVYDFAVSQYKQRRQAFLNNLFVSGHYARAADSCGK